MSSSSVRAEVVDIPPAREKMYFGFFDVPREYLKNERLALQMFEGVIVISAASRGGDTISYLGKHKDFSEYMERYEPVFEVVRHEGKPEAWVKGMWELEYVFKGWKKAGDQGVLFAKATTTYSHPGSVLQAEGDCS